MVYIPKEHQCPLCDSTRVRQMPPRDVPISGFAQRLPPHGLPNRRTDDKATFFARIIQASANRQALSWHPSVHGVLEVAHLHVHAILDFQRISFEPAGCTPPTAVFPRKVYGAILFPI